MDQEAFSRARAKLGKTQKELADLLGVSLKAVQSYDQGWRRVPLHIERSLYFLLANQRGTGNRDRRQCWERQNCTCREQCPAWEFQAGHMCWFLSGTLCDCAARQSWREKMEVCRSCEVLSELL